MSIQPIDPPPRRYWVIGGKQLDASLQKRQWSEVFGPFSAPEEAETIQRRMAAVYAAHPHVWFLVVQDAAQASYAAASPTASGSERRAGAVTRRPRPSGFRAGPA